VRVNREVSSVGHPVDQYSPTVDCSGCSQVLQVDWNPSRTKIHTQCRYAKS